MVNIDLATRAARDPQAKEILDSGRPHTEAAKILGVGESSVRRYRRKNPTTAAIKYQREPVPKGWEPYAEESGKIGSAVVHLPRPGATERDLLLQSGFDPDAWRISGSVNTRRWMRYDQEWLYYYKFDVEQGESPEAREVHVKDLVKAIRKKVKPKPGFYNLDHPQTYVHVISDWQLGKREGEKGTVDTVNRYRDCLAQAVSNIQGLRKMGVHIDRLAVVSVGDLVEGCGDHYAMQTFSIDLDRRGQNRLVRELLTLTITTLAPMFKSTIIAGVGGNHGENRKDGQAFTTFADNDDVGCLEAVKEAFDLAGWTDLEWHIPNDELSICVDLGGVNLGLVHGHQFKGGVNALKKAEDWWRANDFGLQPVREAQILLSGHFHHFVAVNVAHHRSWIQAPTIDPGSKWYTDTSGVTAIPGVLNFVVTPESPVGYDHLRVLHPADDYPTS